MLALVFSAFSLVQVIIGSEVPDGNVIHSDLKGRCSYEHIGCWKDGPQMKYDSTNTVDLLSKEWRGTGFDNAASKCFEASLIRNYEGFALQYGGACRTDRTIMERYDGIGESSKCVDGTGGGWANDVYRIVCEEIIPEPTDPCDGECMQDCVCQFNDDCDIVSAECEDPPCDPPWCPNGAVCVRSEDWCSFLSVRYEAICGDDEDGNEFIIEYSEEEYDRRQAAGDLCPGWSNGRRVVEAEECAVKNCVSCFSDNSKKCETCKEGFKAKKGGKKCKKTKKGKGKR